VREVSVEKGYDPRDFVMIASGGAGPLHALAIARELHIPTVVVPLFPSHFSALGMLLADERHDFIRTFYSDLASLDFDTLVTVHDEMVAEAQAGLRHSRGATRLVHLDLRYVGQEFTLSVPVTFAQLKKADRAGIREAFDRLYEHRYAHHSPEEPVEMVNIRVAVVGKRAKLNFPAVRSGRTVKPVRRRPVHFGDAVKPVACSVYARDTLGAGSRIAGPALIEEHGTTTVLDTGDVCRVAASGELIVSVGGAR
jgi:N-methylhydantoinase A